MTYATPATRADGGSPYSSRPPAWPYLAVLVVWLAAAYLIVLQAVDRFRSASPAGLEAVAIGAVLAIVALSMIVGLLFLLTTLAKSAWYLFERDGAGRASSGTATPPIAVLYLTAGDFDRDAVRSLLDLESDGPLLFILHDDGEDEAARRRMASFIEAHPARGRWEVRILHRPRRTGGKPGAVNWVLERLEEEWPLLLLCDSDSVAIDNDALRRSAGEFDDASVAIVQFRNVAYVAANEPEFHRRLARAIDVFDALARPQARFGYVPFMGHNALLRLAHVREAGGLTPGFFSDDLDLSARLTIGGQRIVYRPDVVFAERHPSDVTAFRKRTRKWAYGCTQVVRTRALDVVRARGIPFAHRAGLLEFMAFYPATLLLIAGLLLAFTLLPWLAPLEGFGGVLCGTIGAGVLAALMAPTFAWSVRNGRLAEWPMLALSCILVYGGSIFAGARGVLDGLSLRERPWIPTNLHERRPAVPRVAIAEAGLGTALLGVPWYFGGPELAFPSTYLFIAVFLLSPLTFATYRDPADMRTEAAEERPRRRLRWAWQAGAACVAILAAAGIVRAEPPEVRTQGKELLLNGEPLEVRGVHYSPWEPGTGPSAPETYPGRELVEADLRRIEELGANAILVHTTPAWVIEHAWREHGLVTFYQFFINFNDTSEEYWQKRSDEIVAEVASLKGTEGVALWLLGNEAPKWVVDELGEETVEARLGELAAKVREVDPRRLVSHANWPVTRTLSPPNMDVVCYNVYPAWPYEVAIRGFGPYINDILAPLAGDRPLLISEFGVNTLEASQERQAELLVDCWTSIREGPAVGGVVMEWSDEWWKNYDNPIADGDYWNREHAPDDADRHDADPEEYYGIVRGDRTAKPAYSALREAWRGAGPQRSMVPWIVILVIATGATVLIIRTTRRREGRGEGAKASEGAEPLRLTESGASECTTA